MQLCLGEILESTNPDLTAKCCLLFMIQTGRNNFNWDWGAKNCQRHVQYLKILPKCHRRIMMNLCCEKGKYRKTNKKYISKKFHCFTQMLYTHGKFIKSNYFYIINTYTQIWLNFEMVDKLGSNFNGLKILYTFFFLKTQECSNKI